MASRARESERRGRSNASQGVRARALNLLVQCYAESVGADTALLLGQRPNPGVQVLATWTREGREAAAPWTSQTLLGRALAGDGPLIESQPHGAGGRHQASAGPVRSNEAVIGAIYAGFEPPSRQARDELVWTTERYASLAALCMSDEALSGALGSSGYDPLTGCLTYAAATEVLRSEVRRSQRRGHRMAVCMIDLDGFKRVNDQRGHIEGNRVLSAVGSALRAAAREYDTVGRFGGDEFMIVLPETDGNDGASIAGRFLASVRGAAVTQTGVPLDASVGIVEWDGECSPTELLARADEVMREVKNHGGGRVKSEGTVRGHADGFTDLSRFIFGALRDQGSGGTDGPRIG